MNAQNKKKKKKKKKKIPVSRARLANFGHLGLISDPHINFQKVPEWDQRLQRKRKYKRNKSEGKGEIVYRSQHEKITLNISYANSEGSAQLVLFAQ